MSAHIHFPFILKFLLENNVALQTTRTQSVDSSTQRPNREQLDLHKVSTTKVQWTLVQRQI